MDAIREWAICLIMAALAGSVVCVILPRGSAEKTVRTIVGIFIIAVICAPIPKLAKTDFEYVFAASYDIEDSAEKLNELSVESCRKAIESELKPIADKYGITIISAETNAFVDEYSCINIQYIQLKIKDADSAAISGFVAEAEESSGIPVNVSVD